MHQKKCQISQSYKPGTVEKVRFPRKMLLEHGWTCEKMPLSWKMHRTHECHSFAVKNAWNFKRDSRADCSWARLVNPEVKASDVFLFGLHPKMKPETFLVGSEAYKLEVKASHMLLRGLHPT